MDTRPDFTLPDDLMAALPEPVQALIISQQAYIKVLEARIKDLETRVRDLEARLAQDSQNSSKPPSSDPPWKQRPGKSRSGRKQGGQPGHPGHHRFSYSHDEVDRVVDVRPSTCKHCHASIGTGGKQEGEYWTHQVAELPEVTPAITEYRLYSETCAHCGKKTRASLPTDVPARPYGPRLQAVAAMLTGRYRMSRRETRQALFDLFGVRISLGALSQLEGATSDALAWVVDKAAQAAKNASIVNMDETGWKEAGERTWLWTAVMPGVTLFKIAPTRGGVVVNEILGTDFSGVVGSDRYGAYNRIPVERRAVCFAHLKRNFQALAEREDEDQFVGVWGLQQIERVFALWHKYKAGEIDRETLRKRLRPVQREFRKLLEYGKASGSAKTRTLCWSLTDIWDALWTFSRIEGVEPTNNAAERALRPGVLWRKGSFGTQSDRGNRFAERMMTVIASCRQQERHLLTFLQETCQAMLAGTAPPSLARVPAEGT
ncbi:MAG: IS66 family transposase [Chloroflexi bacterium]|nr:IS66 family transposase [Chloroflexota bacterium]